MAVYTQQNKPEELHKLINIFDKKMSPKYKHQYLLNNFPKSLVSVGVQ